MLKRFAVAVLLLVAVASSAGAVPVTYVMQGVVDSVPSVFTSVAVGDSFTATLTVETSTPGIVGGGSSIDYYSGAVTDVAFSIGTYTGGTGAGWDIRIQDTLQSYDQLLLIGNTIGGPPLDGYTPNRFGLELRSQNQMGLSSGALLLPTDLTHFDYNYFELQGIGGHITSIQVVPEPSLLALLGAGSLAFALRRRTAA